MHRLCRSAPVIAAAATLSGCGLPYYWQAVGGQLELLRKRTPIEAVIADPAQDESVKATLSSVAEMRAFAVASLGLPDNDSYTTYVDLERSYVVWNVIAAEEFSVEPRRWCFPFAGCVAYRGFFDRADAERFQHQLDEDGFDTYSGGASAYSTLGYFDDPVLNTMLDGGEEYIAGLLFHELAHQKLYVKDDSELSEAFATAVEEHGMELWLTERGAPDALATYRERVARRIDFGQLVAAQQARLREIYDSAQSDEAKRAAKAESFEIMREDYARLKARWGGIGDYDGWFTQPLNNATLVAVATYRRWLPALRWRLDQLGLDAFYREIETISELPAEERASVLDAWLEQASTSHGAPQLR